ncbi:MAG: DUF4230 domain-containing protein [Saprospiraceae bacterium]|nr:DUF4230 domain-containing protein [Saprospiraceae bacterium]
MLKDFRQWLWFLVALVFVFFLGNKYLTFSDTKVEISSSVLLEKVHEVTKLIAVEGQFSELFKFEESWGYAISPLTKSAVVRVQATALIGYDLEGLSVVVDENANEIRIRKLPPAKLVSLEKNLDYYDFKQGLFNSFTKTDLNLIDHKADQILRTKIDESDLFVRAENQLRNHLQTLHFSLNSFGWDLVIPSVSEENSELMTV